MGGEGRLDQTLFTKAGDSLIVNVGTDYWQDHEQHPRDTGNWSAWFVKLVSRLDGFWGIQAY